MSRRRCARQTLRPLALAPDTLRPASGAHRPPPSLLSLVVVGRSLCGSQGPVCGPAGDTNGMGMGTAVMRRKLSWAFGSGHQNYGL